MPQISYVTGKVAPAGIADGTVAAGRGGRYGEGMVIPVGSGIFPLAEEGSYFKAINSVPETGIAQTIQATFLATNGLLNVFNNGTKNIYLDYLRLINTVVGTSTTRSACLFSVDQINRYSSGGSLLTGVNANSGSALGSSAVIRFGALTLAAESGAIRRLSRAQLRAAIMVQFEEWVIDFGSFGGNTETMGGATALRNQTYLGPGLIMPGHSGTLHVWNTGNVTTAPSWECELGYIER